MLKVGDKAPPFSLADQNDRIVSLDGLKGKWVVLFFYPKDHTPGRTAQSCSFRDHPGRDRPAYLFSFVQTA